MFPKRSATLAARLRHAASSARGATLLTALLYLAANSCNNDFSGFRFVEENPTHAGQAGSPTSPDATNANPGTDPDIDIDARIGDPKPSVDAATDAGA